MFNRPLVTFKTRLVFPEKTTSLSFMWKLFADMTVINPFDFFVEKLCRSFSFAYTKELKKGTDPYCTSGLNLALY